MGMIDEVARFAAESGDVPDDALERTKLVLADCIGAIVGGAAEPEVAAFALRMADGSVLLIGTKRRAVPAQAALINGTAGTWLEMDEGNQFARGHPGMHTVPAVLAMTREDISGRDLLTAIAIGYEIGARIGIASTLRPSMHPHGTWGTICAAVGVQRLMGADAKRMREAINIAATLGLATSKRTMLEGGTVRNLFAGISGQMGVTIHDMLDAGFCGEVDGLTHVYGNVVSESFDPAAMTEGLGERWEVTRNYFKMHSCCRFNHAALDALAQITVRRPIDPEEIESIKVRSYAMAAELDDPAPRNVLAAKFSVPFAVATVLVNGSSGVSSFTMDQLGNPAILALAARVSVAEDPAMTAKLPDKRPAHIAVTLKNGEVLIAETETNKGDWSDPYPPEAIREKYLSLTDRLWRRDAAMAVYDTIMALDNADSIAPLLKRMADAPANRA